MAEEKTSYLLCVLISTFAIGSWVDINGLWVQTPLLVQQAPEQWTLPSMLVIIIQIANIGPILFLLSKKIFKNKVREAPVIYIILAVGCLSCVFLGIFWKYTVHLAGMLRSIPMLVLAFFLAIVDCTSSLVFMPYLSVYASPYMTALYIGEGLSGLIPGVVALIQGVGGNAQCVNSTVNGTTRITPVYPKPLFSVQVFFFFLAAMLLVSFIAFTIVDCHPKLKKYRTTCYYRVSADNDYGDNGSTTDKFDMDVIDSKKSISSTKIESVEMPGTKTCIVFLILVTWINALTNGFLPSLQSYSMLPYGNTSYHLGVILSNIANPLACFVTFFWKLKAIKWISLISLIGSISAGYLTYLAFASPTPPLQNHLGGKILMVTVAFLVIALFSYAKACIALELQKTGKSYLTLCGFFTQVGSFIGAISSFLIVNVFKLLTSAPPC